MFRSRSPEFYVALLSTGDTVPLLEVPQYQLQQTLCSSLAYIQRAEKAALRFLSITSAMRGEREAVEVEALTPLADNARSLQRYNPDLFHGYTLEGSRVSVSNMSLADLIQNTVRAFTVCEHATVHADGKEWYSQRPALTIGPRLKALKARASELGPLGRSSEAAIISRFNRLRKGIQALVIEEAGFYEDTPSYADTKLAIRNVPMWVDGVDIRPSLREIMDRLAPAESEAIHG